MVSSGMGATAKYSFKAKRFYTVTPTGAWRFEKTAKGLAGNQIDAVFSAGSIVAQSEKNK